MISYCIGNPFNGVYQKPSKEKLVCILINKCAGLPKISLRAGHCQNLQVSSHSLQFDWLLSNQLS